MITEFRIQTLEKKAAYIAEDMKIIKSLLDQNSEILKTILDAIKQEKANA